jgi:hypothetical protein
MVDITDYKYDIYEVNYSSLYTLFSSSPGTNFPNITFAGNGGSYTNSFESLNFLEALKKVQIYTVSGIKNFEDMLFPSKPSERYNIDYSSNTILVKRKSANASTLNYLVGSVADVIASAKEITTQIKNPTEWVVLSNRKRDEELLKLFDDTWARQLTLQANIINDSYSHMGLIHTNERKSSQSIDFNTWLITNNVPLAVRTQITNLINKIGDYKTSTGKDLPAVPPNTSLTFLTGNDKAYTLNGVYYDIEKITNDPRWQGDNPIQGTIPWTKWGTTSRPRLDSGVISGRLVVPATADRSIEGTFTIKYKDIVGHPSYQSIVSLGSTFTGNVPSAYTAYFVPTSDNWKYTTDSYSYFKISPKITDLSPTNFKLSFNVPANLSDDVAKSKILGDTDLVIKWKVTLKTATELLLPTLELNYFDHLLSGYRDIDQSTGNYTVYSTEALEKKFNWSNNFLSFNVQYWTTGDKNLIDSITDAIADIQSLYTENYISTCATAAKTSIFGDYIVFNGRLADSHGEEINLSTRQVLQLARYANVLSKKNGDAKLSAIIDERCPKVYSASIDTVSCTLPRNPEDILVDTHPLQISTTESSTLDKVKTGKGKVLYILPVGASIK